MRWANNLFKFVLIAWISSITVSYADERVVYPRPEEDDRYKINIEILKAVLEATKDKYGGYTMQPSGQTMSESRQMQELGNNTGSLTVSWSGTSFIDMGSLHYVPIPLLNGLLSYRLLVTKKERLNEFRNISLRTLRKKVTAHAHGWGDSFVFEEAGLQGHITSYRGLYSLLRVGRIDYLSRGVTEAYEELNNPWRKEQYEIVPDVMLFYPWPYYFYVNRENRVLEQRLTDGLNIIISNGTHQELLDKFTSSALKQANLSKRKIIVLSNPWMEDGFDDIDCKDCIYVPEGLSLSDLQ